MKKLLPLLYCWSLLFPIQLFAQLSGSYTVGSASSDYASFSAAMSDLRSKGMNNDVTFLLSGGTYAPLSMDSIPALYGSHRLLVRPQSIASKVLIQGTTRLEKASNVTFKGLSFKSLGSRSNCLVLNKVKDCRIVNCRFSSPSGDSLGYRSRDYAALMIHNNFRTNDSNHVLIRGCVFTGQSNSVYTSGSAGALRIVSTDFGKTGQLNFTSQWPGSIEIDSCTMPRGIDMDWAQSGTFSNNTTAGYGELYFARVVNNHFTSKERIDLQAEIVENNLFSGAADLSATLWMQGNTFMDDMELSRTSGSTILKNKVEGSARLSRVENAHVDGNEFKGEFRASFCFDINFVNNLLYERAEFGISDGADVSHNNFAKYAAVSVTNGSVYANNFGGETFVGGSFISHNNYYPGYGSSDNYPFHIDPQYPSSGELRAQNPLLAGQAPSVPDVVFDFDNNRRQGPATVGAHEICVNVGDPHAEIALDCGIPIRLKLCDAKSKGGDHWLPSTYLDDAASLSPLATPNKDITYYLVNKTDSVLDSIRIKKTAIDLSRSQSFTAQCGNGALLAGLTYPNAIYSIAPQSHLEYGSNINPYARPPRTTEYIRTIKVPGCGTFYDTFLVQIDRKPQAWAWATDTLKEVHFQGFAICADSVHWDFGDGNSSTQLDVKYEYDDWGHYRAILSVFTDSLVDRDTISILLLSSIDRLPETHGFNLYPNPSASGNFSLEHDASLNITRISLWSIDGTLIDNDLDVRSKQFSIDAPKGMYLLRVESEKSLPFYFKAIKQ